MQKLKSRGAGPLLNVIYVFSKTTTLRKKVEKKNEAFDVNGLSTLNRLLLLLMCK